MSSGTVNGNGLTSPAASNDSRAGSRQNASEIADAGEEQSGEAFGLSSCVSRHATLLWLLCDAGICIMALILCYLAYVPNKWHWFAPEDRTAMTLLWVVWSAISVALLVRFVRFLLADNTSGQTRIPAVILGPAEIARELCGALTCARSEEFIEREDISIAPFLADDIQEYSTLTDSQAALSETKYMERFVECHGILSGIVAIPPECDGKTLELVEKSVRIFKNLFIAPQVLGQRVTARASVDAKAVLRIYVGNHPAHRGTPALKRLVDIVGAFVLGLLALPFCLLVALVIGLTSQGPVLYRQLRIGKGNRLFWALKFRTMFIDAGERLTHHLKKDSALQAEWERVHKLKYDPRVTPAGRFLRRFSVDELPQIWNTLVGEMSLIGPRPIVISEIERYGLDYAAYEVVRPGLTGLWQVSGRNDTTYQQRVAYDAYYVRNWSFGLDARIVAKTLRAIISGAGAY